MTTPSHTVSLLQLSKNLEDQKQLDTGPKLKRGIFHQFTYWPANKLIKKGFKTPLTHQDVWQIVPNVEANNVWEKFEPHWNEEIQCWRDGKKPSLLRAIWRTFRWPWLGALCLNTIYGLLTFVNPIFLPFLIQYVSNFDIPAYEGWIYLVAIIFTAFFSSFIWYYTATITGFVGIRVRAVLFMILYRKMLTLAPTKDSNTGELVNLVSSDAQFISDTINLFTLGFVAPLQIIICVILLWFQISYFSLVCLGVFLLTLPIAAFLGRRFGKFRRLIQIAADKRLKITTELLQGIRVVKFNAWEKPFIKNITKYRREELKYVKSLSYNRSWLIFVVSNTLTVGIALTFLLYGFLGPSGSITPALAFTTLSLLNLLRFPFTWLPVMLQFLNQYIVAFRRVQDFVIHKPDITPVERREGDDIGIRIVDGEFKWDPTSNQNDSPTLKDINIEIKKGELVMIVGAVGSGKSSLLMAILGEIPKIKGNVQITGKLAYVSQEAWIFNASVRENILFGEPFDEKKYEEVIDVSALRPDFAQLPAGDQTEIGERGINLSGGQKQRVSVARALYSNRDIYILDDPFSAVDAHVGKHLFDEALKKYLKGKTIVLATNQLQYLPHADKIVFLKKGSIVDQGTFTELMNRCDEFRHLMDQGGVRKEKSPAMKQKRKRKEPVEEHSKEQLSNDNTSQNQNPSSEMNENGTETKPQKSTPVLNGPSSGTLTKAEEKETGLVSFKVYWYYFKSGGLFLFLIITLFLISFSGANVLSSWWLSVWSNPTNYPQFSGFSVDFYIWIYIAWMGASALFFFLALFLLVSFSIKASFFLHKVLLEKVVYAPTWFYDITPIGRILNRFAKELFFIDNLLPLQLSQYMLSVFSILGVFASMCFASPYLALVFAAAVVGYVFFERYYRHTSIELQRLEALSRAPIFSHLSETIKGGPTIRAYDMQEAFKNVNIYRVNYNTQEKYAQRYATSWFGLRLDWIGTCLVFATITAIVITRTVSPDTINPGFAGLALTYTAGISFVLSNLSLNAAETETRMNSIERIKEYEKLPQEAPAIIKTNRPPPDWPQKGKIVFKNLSLKYRNGPLVLNNINVRIKPREKVGIVGRTGSGKSSLMQALFRMVEPAEGTIIIDGIDITTIGLEDLRSKLSIIPQDPTLFTGSIRYNLDPFREYSDEEIWKALALVQLKNVVEELEGMARALLRRSKILVMDEATASVDLHTDSLIQRMVRTEFVDCTVLTIAHRLNTIMDSDKVMVLDKGHLVEFGKPAKLLKIENGYFASMVNATGPAVAEYLRKLATGEIRLLDTLKSPDSKEGGALSWREVSQAAQLSPRHREDKKQQTEQKEMITSK